MSRDCLFLCYQDTKLQYAVRVGWCFSRFHLYFEDVWEGMVFLNFRGQVRQFNCANCNFELTSLAGDFPPDGLSQLHSGQMAPELLRIYIPEIYSPAPSLHGYYNINY